MYNVYAIRSSVQLYWVSLLTRSQVLTMTFESPRIIPERSISRNQLDYPGVAKRHAQLCWQAEYQSTIYSYCLYPTPYLHTPHCPYKFPSLLRSCRGYSQGSTRVPHKLPPYFRLLYYLLGNNLPANLEPPPRGVAYEYWVYRRLKN